MIVRDAQSGDNAALAELYNHYVLNTVTTFEEEPVSAEEMGARVQDVVSWNLPWIVPQGVLEEGNCAVSSAGRQACHGTGGQSVNGCDSQSNVWQPIWERVWKAG